MSVGALRPPDRAHHRGEAQVPGIVFIIVIAIVIVIVIIIVIVIVIVIIIIIILSITKQTFLRDMPSLDQETVISGLDHNPTDQVVI